MTKRFQCVSSNGNFKYGITGFSVNGVGDDGVSTGVNPEIAKIMHCDSFSGNVTSKSFPI